MTTWSLRRSEVSLAAWKMHKFPFTKHGKFILPNFFYLETRKAQKMSQNSIEILDPHHFFFRPTVNQANCHITRQKRIIYMTHSFRSTFLPALSTFALFVV